MGVDFTSLSFLRISSFSQVFCLWQRTYYQFELRTYKCKENDLRAEKDTEKLKMYWKIHWLNDKYNSLWIVLFQKSRFDLQDGPNDETPQIKENYQIKFKVVEKYILECNVQLAIIKPQNSSFHWHGAKPGYNSSSALSRCIRGIALKLFSYAHIII